MWRGALVYLVDEPPGGPDALLDVSDEAVAHLEGGVVVQGRPDLVTHILNITFIEG